MEWSNNSLLQQKYKEKNKEYCFVILCGIGSSAEHFSNKLAQMNTAEPKGNSLWALDRKIL